MWLLPRKRWLLLPRKRFLPYFRSGYCIFCNFLFSCVFFFQKKANVRLDVHRFGVRLSRQRPAPRLRSCVRWPQYGIRKTQKKSTISLFSMGKGKLQNSVSCLRSASMRLHALSKYSLLSSNPIKWRFSRMQATAVVPLPMQLSRIVSPSLE